MQKYPQSRRFTLLACASTTSWPAKVPSCPGLGPNLNQQNIEIWRIIIFTNHKNSHFLTIYVTKIVKSCNNILSSQITWCWVEFDVDRRRCLVAAEFTGSWESVPAFSFSSPSPTLAPTTHSSPFLSSAFFPTKSPDNLLATSTTGPGLPPETPIFLTAGFTSTPPNARSEAGIRSRYF